MIVLAAAVVGLVWWFLVRPTARRRRRAGKADDAGLPPVTRRERLVVGPPVVDAVIELSGVSKAYGRGERRRLALDGLDLAVPAGGVFGVLGQNGAGKTTALRCILGLTRATSGTCRVLGVDSARELHRVIGRVGALIETPGLDPDAVRAAHPDPARRAVPHRIWPGAVGAAGRRFERTGR